MAVRGGEGGFMFSKKNNINYWFMWVGSKWIAIEVIILQDNIFEYWYKFIISKDFWTELVGAKGDVAATAIERE